MNGISLSMGAIIGILMVPLASLLKSEGWSQRTKFIASMVVTLVAAGAQTFFDNHVQNLTQFVALWSVTFGTAQLIYQTYFKGTALDAKLTGITVGGTTKPNAA